MVFQLTTFQGIRYSLFAYNNAGRSGGVADCYNSMGKNADLAPREAIPPAKAAAQRALELDPGLAEAHAALADSKAIYDWNWVEAERGFNRALELNPNVAFTHLAYATSYLPAQGRADEVVAEIQRALELEPLSLIYHSILVTGYLFARQNDKALQQGQKALELDPNFWIARQWLGVAYIANGMYDEAREVAEGGLRLSSANSDMLFVVGLAHAKQGRRREAEQVIAQLRATARTRYVRTYWLACIYAALGDKDKAFAELEKSYEDRDNFLPRAKIDPLIDPLRDDPRFKDLLKRMKLPE
jgi:tetratricopeptide (TPR) repeat protein